MPFDSAKCLGMPVNVHFSLDRLVRKKGQLWGEVEKKRGGGGVATVISELLVTFL